MSLFDVIWRDVPLGTLRGKSALTGMSRGISYNQFIYRELNFVVPF